FTANANVNAEFHAASSRQQMATLAAVLVRNGTKILFVMGGDGTLQTVVNVPEIREAVIGILPLGTGNDYAAALGIPRNPVQAMRTLLAGRPKRLDLVRMRTANGCERLYCGGGGLGLDAEAARLASERYAWLRGRVRYVAAALHAFCTFTPLTVRVEFPDTNRRAIEKRVLVTAALNTPTYGAGLRLAAKARLDDGLLDLTFVEPLRLPDVAGIALDWTFSGQLRTSRVSTQSAARLRFTSDRPCMFQADGEIMGPAPIEVQAVPAAVNILLPADSSYL